MYIGTTSNVIDRPADIDDQFTGFSNEELEERIVYNHLRLTDSDAFASDWGNEHECEEALKEVWRIVRSRPSTEDAEALYEISNTIEKMIRRYAEYLTNMPVRA